MSLVRRLGVQAGLAAVVGGVVLQAVVSAAVVSGTVKDIAPDTRKVVVQLKDGKTKVFSIAEDAAVTLDDKKAGLLEIEPGATITVTTDKGNLATRVSVRRAAKVEAKPEPKTKKKPATKPAPKEPDDDDAPPATQPPPRSSSTPRTTTGTRNGNAKNVPGFLEGTWPQFLGPNRDNKSTETGLLESWPADGPRLVWTAEGCGQGYSSVTVAGDQIYTMGNIDGEECVVAFEAASGRQVWKRALGPASKLSAGDGPRSSPTVDGEWLYALGGNGDLASLNFATGEIRWQQNILKEYNGENISWGICESVLIDGDKLICTPGGRDGTLVAINKANGRNIWRCNVPRGSKAGYASAIGMEVGGVRTYVQFAAAGTFGVRADDGDFLWGSDKSANGTANCSSPVVWDGNVFSASGYGQGGGLIKLSGGRGGITATDGFYTKNMKSHHGGMVVVGDYLYGADENIFTCLDLKGGRVAWQTRDSVGKGAVTFADGHIYLRSENGPMSLVEANPSEFVEKGRFDQPRRSGANSWSYPVVAGGKLLLRDQDVLLCFDVKE